ncbi:MAG: hypothetical protein JNK82_14420 [Myxococcaceae bacterium]|nr:hypothetical protein [Myxococcaceae bacterium]
MPTRIRHTPFEIDGYKVDDTALKTLFEKTRGDGKTFSIHELATKSKKYDDGDKYLNLTELQKGYAEIPVTRLPPQVGEKASPAVLTALQRAWATYADKPAELEAARVSRVPKSFARVIVGTSGTASSPEQVYHSVYVQQRKSGLRMNATNEVYFEKKRFGETSLFGPFNVDKLGIPTSDVPPPLKDDGASLESKLKGLPSQREVAGATKLQLETFDFDATTNDDVAIYEQVAKSQFERLTEAQREEVEKLAAYKQFGSQTAAVNDWLRSSRRAQKVNPSVVLLDQAFERAVELPKGMLLFRGIAAEGYGGKPGTKVIDPAYLSTSLDPGIARMFADNSGDSTGQRRTLIVIEAGENARGVVSGNRGETEILLDRGLELEVVRERREKGYTLLHLRTP